MHIDTLENVLNDLYEFAISKEFSEDLKKAEGIFVLNEDHSDSEGFAEWFIFNYRLTQSQKTLVEMFKYNTQQEDDAIALESLRKSKRSIFELKTEREKRVLKDLFTQEDYVLSHEVFEEDQLISARLATCEGGHYLVGDIYTIESSFKESLKKYVLEQYNQYCITSGQVSWDVFLDLNAQLLYKVMGILTRVEEENTVENELMLYQATYAFLCSIDALHDQFIQIDLPIFADEDEEPILRVMEEENVIAEIEITNGQFYVLCNTQEHLDHMMTLLEAMLTSEIVFVKTEQFTLEDLL